MRLRLWCTLFAGLAALATGPADAQGPSPGHGGPTAPAAQNPDAGTVERLVAKLYDIYKPGGNVEGAGGPLTFDDSLLKLMDRLDKKDSEGLGFDPFCSCQDFEIRNLSVKARSASPQAATVVARFQNFGEWTEITYKLVMTPKGWRIQDMVLPEAPSLRAMIARSLG